MLSGLSMALRKELHGNYSQELAKVTLKHALLFLNKNGKGNLIH